MNTQHQASWSLGTENINPVTPPWCFTISQSENHAQRIHHRPCEPPPHLLFKSALQKPFGELVSLHGLGINLPLLQTPAFQFVWPHCASGTWTSFSWSCSLCLLLSPDLLQSPLVYTLLAKRLSLLRHMAFPGGASGKELTCQRWRHGFDPWVRIITWSRNGNPFHSPVLAWRIPWMEEPGGLRFIGSVT